MIDGYKELTPVIYGENAIKYLYTEQKKFKAKIGYADKLSIPFVIFLGEDEIAQHVCALKNMATGVQEAVTRETALETIRAEIARRSAGAILREP